MSTIGRRGNSLDVQTFSYMVYHVENPPWCRWTIQQPHRATLRNLGLGIRRRCDAPEKLSPCTQMAQSFACYELHAGLGNCTSVKTA